MIQKILIGPAEGHRSVGIAEFILFALHYRPLLVRLAAAAAVWRVFAWLEWGRRSEFGIHHVGDLCLAAGDKIYRRPVSVGSSAGY
jgi:hypothetical protein